MSEEQKVDTKSLTPEHRVVWKHPDAPREVEMREDEDGLLPVEQSLASVLWDRWSDPDGAPCVTIKDDPRTVARALRSWLLANVDQVRREVAAGIETERESNATARRLLAEAREQVADLREALATIAGATTIADAVPDVRAFARAALGRTPDAVPEERVVRRVAQYEAELRAEVERLREGIIAVVAVLNREFYRQPATWIERLAADLRTLLAEPGEQPGERARCSECGPGYRVGDEGCRHRPAPAVSLPRSSRKCEKDV